MTSERKIENQEDLSKLSFEELVSQYLTAPDNQDEKYHTAISYLFEAIDAHPKEKSKVEAYINQPPQDKARFYLILAYANMHSIGADMDPKKIEAYIKKAIQLKNDRAVKMLGLMYKSGSVLQKNFKEAERYCLEAIALPVYKNDAHLHITLGDIYCFDTSNKLNDEEKGLKYYLHAEQLAHDNPGILKEAWRAIGYYYKTLLDKSEKKDSKEEEVLFNINDPNYKKAKEYLTKAHKAGDRAGCYLLAEIILRSNEDKSEIEAAANFVHTMIERDIDNLQKSKDLFYLTNPTYIRLFKYSCVRWARAYTKEKQINKAALYYYYSSFYKEEIFKFSEEINFFYNKHKSKPVVRYYYALYSDRDKHGASKSAVYHFSELLKTSPQTIFELWSKDLDQSASESMTKNLIDIMRDALQEIGNNNNVFVDKIKFTLAEKLNSDARSNVILDVYSYIFDLSPKNLSAEENYLAGFHLYNFLLIDLTNQENRKYFCELIKSKESVFYRIKYNITAVPLEKISETINSLRTHMYSHLKAAASTGHQKAKSFLLMIAYDRINMRSAGDSYKNYCDSELEFPDSFDEFINKFKKLIIETRSKDLNKLCNPSNEHKSQNNNEKNVSLLDKVIEIRDLFNPLLQEQKHTTLFGNPLENKERGKTLAQEIHGLINDYVALSNSMTLTIDQMISLRSHIILLSNPKESNIADKTKKHDFEHIKLTAIVEKALNILDDVINTHSSSASKSFRG